MWFRILAIVGVLIAIDGLVLTFYPERISKLLRRFADEDSSLLANHRVMRGIGLVEMTLGLCLMAAAWINAQ